MSDTGGLDTRGNDISMGVSISPTFLGTFIVSYSRDGSFLEEWWPGAQVGEMPRPLTAIPATGKPTTESQQP